MMITVTQHSKSIEIFFIEHGRSYSVSNLGASRFVSDGTYSRCQSILDKRSVAGEKREKKNNNQLDEAANEMALGRNRTVSYWREIYAKGFISNSHGTNTQ